MLFSWNLQTSKASWWIHIRFTGVFQENLPAGCCISTISGGVALITNVLLSSHLYLIAGHCIWDIGCLGRQPENWTRDIPSKKPALQEPELMYSFAKLAEETAFNLLARQEWDEHHVLRQASLWSLGMHTFSLWLENHVKQQSRDKVKYCIKHQAGAEHQSFPNQRKTYMNSVGLSDWSASVPEWGSVTCLWAILIFFLRYILETKSFTPLNKTRRIVPVPTSCWCLFTTQVLLLWAIKDTLQGKEFVQLTLFQAPMPSAPNTWKQRGRAGFRSSLQSWAPSGTCTSPLQLIACSLWYWNEIRQSWPACQGHL